MNDKKYPKLTPDYLADSITEHMHQQFVRLRADWTIRQATEELQKHDLSEQIVYLYVVDEQDRLAGVVPVRRLLSSSPESKISGVMISNVISIRADATIQQAGNVLLKHKLLAVPVVNENGQLIGVVDLSHFTQDTLSVEQKPQIDSMFQLLGLHISLKQRASIWMMFRERFPWLLWNIVSGLLCAFIASRYELLIQEIVMLAMFMTVVLALGESVGMQAMSITVQRLATRELNWSSTLSSLRRELSAAGLMAVGSAIILTSAAILWKGHWTQALAVGFGVILSILTACFLGVLVPSLIRALRIDPKIAAGPIALACIDICTLLYYFNIMNIITH
jgi:magnesium transporter